MDRRDFLRRTAQAAGLLAAGSVLGGFIPSEHFAELTRTTFRGAQDPAWFADVPR